MFHGGEPMKNFLELHCHSSASDGSFSPSALVNHAFSRGIRVMALTDHDTTEGVDEAMKEGNKLKIKVIPGIELSTLYKGENVHILGYFKDDGYKDIKLQGFLKELKDYREYRGRKIIENLDSYFNIQLDYNKVTAKAKGVLGRPHIAEAIVDAGYPYTFKYIFNNIINNESKAYVPNKKLSILEGINLLKNYGAFVVLAHPVLLKRVSFKEVASYPFDGIEVFYKNNTLKDTEAFASFAREKGLYFCGGSDFHGLEDEKHGFMGEISPPLEEIQKLFKALKIEE